MHPPVRHLATERIAGHLLNADGVQVHIHDEPAVRAAAPDTVHVGSPRQDLVAMHLAAEFTASRRRRRPAGLAVTPARGRP